MYKQITSAALFAAGVAAHGHLSSPAIRPLGDAMKAACGAQLWNMMSSDENGNIQTMAQTGASQSDYDAAACHLYQCRGYQFDDATADTIQSYSAGEVIPMTAVIAAPHTGVANVSIINLAENSVIDTLISWDVYASTATGVSANDTTFSVTMPDTLPDACATAGGCALQWWWDARSVDQTYMSCVDFAFTGSTSGSSSSSSSSGTTSGSSASAAASVAPASSAPAVVASAAPTTTLATSVVPASSAAPAATSEAASANAATGSDSSSCSKKRSARRAALAARARRNN